MPIPIKEKKRVDAPIRAKAQDAPNRKLMSRLKKGEDNLIVVSGHLFVSHLQGRHI